MEKVTNMELLLTQNVKKMFLCNADIVCKNDLTFSEDRWFDTRTKRHYDIIWEIDGDYAYAVNMGDAYDR